MKLLTVTCCFLLLIVCLADAQVANPLDPEKLRKLDSLESKANFQFLSDSLKILSWSDSLKSKVSGRFDLDSAKISSQIDSLRNLNLSPDKYLARLDSAKARKDKLLAEVETKKGALLSKTKGRLAEWKSAISNKLQINAISGNIPDGALPEAVSNISEKVQAMDQSIPDLGSNLPGLPSGTNLTGLEQDVLPIDGLNGLDLPEMPSFETTDLTNLELSSELSSVGDKVNFDYLDNLDGIQDKIGGASQQLGALKDASSNPDQLIETTLDNVEQLDAVKEQLASAESIRGNEFVTTAEKLKDPEAMKEEVKKVVMKKAVNHFAGKEARLQQAMDQLTKYKKKYESIGSLSDLKKLPRNQMKGKPFRARFVPGIAFQVLKRDDLFLDINPYAAYRITGRVNAGAGWNQRIGYSLDHHHFTSGSEVYGPRLFAEFRTWRGFIARAEFETMNTEVPPMLRGPSSDIKGREWVQAAFVGIKKDYRFLRRVRGTAFVMFMVYNQDRKSPYGDVINSRFGFEFPLAKKKVNRQSN